MDDTSLQLAFNTIISYDPQHQTSKAMKQYIDIHQEWDQSRRHIVEKTGGDNLARSTANCLVRRSCVFPTTPCSEHIQNAPGAKDVPRQWSPGHHHHTSSLAAANRNKNKNRQTSLAAVMNTKLALRSTVAWSITDNHMDVDYSCLVSNEMNAWQKWYKHNAAI